MEKSQVKTVLAPGAPWPDYKPKPAKTKSAPKPKPPPRDKSKIKRTDENFEKWRAKNAHIDISAALFPNNKRRTK